MATDKRQFTLRLQDETYEKIRYLAYVDHRSIAMEMEHILIQHIAKYETQHGALPIRSEDFEDYSNSRG
ncbi:hypothetical protein AGMMS49992_29360 [Clostridia bacterium]|nr:hypothetical protein AGMMS49992_29360 [Clostridia bacterium]